jgi:hypothetical protein
MRVAVVLFGQPRDYLKGYNNIIRFIKLQNNCEFDFFYHCWSLNENETYKHSPWRNLEKTSLIYSKNTIAHLQELYNPISCEIENQSDITFDKSLYINSIAFNNTPEQNKANVNNTLFQMYSRNKARNLLYEYLEKTKKSYDFVLTLRFDISNMPEVNLDSLNTSMVHVSNVHHPRKIISDNCIIAPTKVYLDWFTIYDKLEELINNTELMETICALGEDIIINPEQLAFSNYIFHYKNLDNISYFNGGEI